MDLGKFEVIEELGKGGFGIVYKARDKVLDRLIALKIMHPQLLVDPNFILRFKHEAQLAARLDHPYLLPIHEFGEIEGRYYIVMAYMPNGSLKDLLRKEGKLDKQRSLKIFEQICEGMIYAHSQDIIHRDLKPGNILFDNRGNPHISDMGFAKLIHSDSSASMSASDGMVGTPSYMAPEIWRGKPATSATDVYSLACVLVEMLTGEALFGGESSPEIYAKIFDPYQLPEDLPEEWKPVLEAALEKQQEKRIQTVEEFLNQIKAVEESLEESENTDEENKNQDEGEKTPIRAEDEERKTKSGLIYAVFVLMAIIMGVVIFQIGKSFSNSANITVLATATPEETSKPPTKTVVKTPTATFEPKSEFISTKIGEIDGVEQVYVPAGYFFMGSHDDDIDAYDDEKPVRNIYLDAYWIDKYEVTNGQYRACVTTGSCSKPHESKSNDRINYYGNSAYDDYPVIYVNWNQAKSYCEWAGGRLPTEAEWEKAARGDDGRKYPWGNQAPDSSYANYNQNIGDTSEVGSYLKGASPYGAMDMSGNVGEWVNDEYGEYKVLRGGGWNDNKGSIRVAFWYYSNPNDKNNNIGFRCTYIAESDEGVSTTNVESEEKNSSQVTNDSANTTNLGLGPMRIRETDEMEQVYVPSGEFVMGSEDGDDNEKPVRNVFLDAYWIDKYEVSNGQYQECVAAGKCTKPHKSDSFTRNSYYGNSVYDNYPIIAVDWYQAKGYCEWAGGDLPTEAQWEKAARGTDARKYPWGNQEPDRSYANYDENIGDTTEVVGYEKGASPYGALNMAGNVWEWVNDWYAGKYDETDTKNPQGPSGTGEYRVRRGGCFFGDYSVMRAVGQYRSEPDYNMYNLGFRCVSAP